MAVTTARVQSLKRRAAALSAEIERWLARADQDAQFQKNALSTALLRKDSVP